MAAYRKKPVVIEAVHYDGANLEEVSRLMGVSLPAKWDDLIGNPIFIETLEGTMRADVGDFIIRGVNGEYYPCKPEIFAKTYEPVDTRAPDPDCAAEARVKVLEELLKEARTDLEHYVDNDWPEKERAAYPSCQRKYERDMELCRRIDAALERENRWS